MFTNCDTEPSNKVMVLAKGHSRDNFTLSKTCLKSDQGNTISKLQPDRVKYQPSKLSLWSSPRDGASILFKLFTLRTGNRGSESDKSNSVDGILQENEATQVSSNVANESGT